MANGDKLADQPGIMEARFRFNWLAQPLGSTKLYYYMSSQSPLPADMTAWANHASGQWGNFLTELCHPNLTLNEVIATDLTSRQAAQGTWTGGISGTRTGAELPVTSCVLINYILHNRYRGGKPRSYLPFGVDTDTTDGKNWLASFTSLVQTQFGDFLSAVAAGVAPLNAQTQACVHFYKGAIANDNPSVWAPKYVPQLQTKSDNEPIYGYGVSPRIATQVRRNPELGG